jgi:hypothetical protein
MTISSLSDLNAAFDAGRFHVQRITKNAGTSHASKWADPSFASGQPPYDARVGTAATFTPAVAQKNDAIYFPQIEAGMTRYLTEAQIWTSQNTYNGPISIILFDLLGYYPLLDGDSTDEQFCDNTQTLPRYTDGVGVSLVIVNHIAPALQNGVAIIKYINTNDVEQTITVDVPNNGQNLVCSGCRDTAGATSSTFNVPLGSGAKGIKSIVSIQYTTAPGGLHCAYLIKPLGSMVTGDNQVCAEKSFITNKAFAPPRIYDGAWINWLDMIALNGTARTVAWFGNLTFAWG